MATAEKHYNRIAAVFFFAVGLFFAIHGFTVEMGTWEEPGCGFVPFWAGLILALMAGALFQDTLKHRQWTAFPSFFPKDDSWKRVVSAFLALVAYNVFFQFLGFTVSTFLFVGFLVRFIFPQTWRRTLIAAVLTALCARLLFINLLETQLPLGIFGF